MEPAYIRQQSSASDRKHRCLARTYSCRHNKPYIYQNVTISTCDYQPAQLIQKRYTGLNDGLRALATSSKDSHPATNCLVTNRQRLRPAVPVTDLSICPRRSVILNKPHRKDSVRGGFWQGTTHLDGRWLPGSEACRQPFDRAGRMASWTALLLKPAGCQAGAQRPWSTAAGPRTVRYGTC